MKIKIYQIDHHRDENNLKFMDLSYARKSQEQALPDGSIYNKVFEGEVSLKDLEEVYHLFNTSPPEGYKGHSLSVSDVVEYRKLRAFPWAFTIATDLVSNPLSLIPASPGMLPGRLG